MGKAADKLAAYHAHVTGQSPTAPVRVLMSDAEALALVQEVGTGGLRHPEAAAAGVEQLAKALAVEAPSDEDGLEQWAAYRKAARAAFWDAVQGETINGVEIHRSRQ
jgi:hypothetical protein